MTDEKNYEKKSIEDILGPVLYQNERLLWTTFLLVSTAGALTSFNIYVYQFLGATPEHWCLVEDLQNVSWTQDQVKEISLPLENKTGKFSKCDMFQIDYSKLSQLPYEEASKLATTMKQNAKIVQCNHHQFAGEIQTYVTEWDLVCQRRPLYATTQSAIQSGFIVDCFLFGFLTDKFGRRKMFMYCLWGAIISGLLLPLAPNVQIFIILRMLSSTFGLATMNAGLVLCLELSSVKRRSMIGACFSLPWALGIMILPGIAYFIRNWVYLQIAITSPFILLAIFVGILTQESPKWLILNDKPKDACKILKKLNGWSTEKADAMLKEIEALSSQSSESASREQSAPSKLKNVLLDLFSFFTRRDLQVRSLVILFTWFSGSMVYYGLGLGADALDANEYWFIFGGGLAELIALLSLWPLSTYLGRKKGLMVFFAGSSVTILSVALIIFRFSHHDLSWLKVTFYLIGKFSITCAFQLTWIYTNELYPTNLRGLASGAGSSMARVGSLFSPFINDILGQNIKWSPSAIFGGFSVATMFFVLFLPETGQINITEDDLDVGKLKDSDDYQVPTTQDVI